MNFVIKQIRKYKKQLGAEIANLKAIKVTDDYTAAINGSALVEKNQFLLILQIIENSCKMAILATGEQVPDDTD